MNLVSDSTFSSTITSADDSDHCGLAAGWLSTFTASAGTFSRSVPAARLVSAATPETPGSGTYGGQTGKAASGAEVVVVVEVDDVVVDGVVDVVVDGVGAVDVGAGREVGDADVVVGTAVDVVARGRVVVDGASDAGSAGNVVGAALPPPLHAAASANKKVTGRQVTLGSYRGRTAATGCVGGASRPTTSIAYRMRVDEALEERGRALCADVHRTVTEGQPAG